MSATLVHGIRVSCHQRAQPPKTEDPNWHCMSTQQVSFLLLTAPHCLLTHLPFGLILPFSLFFPCQSLPFFPLSPSPSPLSTTPCLPYPLFPLLLPCPIRCFPFFFPVPHSPSSVPSSPSSLFPVPQSLP